MRNTQGFPPDPRFVTLRRPEKDLHPIEYIRAGRTKKAPEKNLRGFVIPIGFKPITF